MTEKEIAKLYDTKKIETDISERKKSEVIHVRNFSNWVKTILIDKYGKEKDKVLEIAVGKGADIGKWNYKKISLLVGVDISKESLKEANLRYEKKYKDIFPAYFFHLDAFKENLYKIIRENIDIDYFDIISCQFALDYAFESEDKLKTLFYNISSNLKSGGYFISTLSDAEMIVEKLRSIEGLTLENDKFKIEFEYKFPFDIYGVKFKYTLSDLLISIPSFLPSFLGILKMTKEFDLEIVERKNFLVFYEEYKKNKKYKKLLDIMNVLDKDKKIPQDEWEVLSFFQVLVLRKL